MKNFLKYISISALGVALSIMTPFSAFASGACEITKTNGGGFTTTIQSVIQNCDNTYTITLRVSHNGCGGPSCMALSHYSVEAQPGTYSNISVAVISGGMTYQTIVFGPDLGSDPFQGFKIDGVSGIGGGQAGVFTITYTISGNLQNQRTSAKAGSNGQIVNFTSADFAYVMNCNGTTCVPTVTDTDGDGVPDEDDDYPTDPDRAFNNYYPSKNVWGTLAYEDLWPSRGDYDFNDVVVIYNTNIVTNASNQVVDIRTKYKVTAVGASFRNGFAFQLDNVTPGQVAYVNGQVMTKGYATLNPNGTEAGQAKAVIFVFDDTEAVINRAGGSFHNTLANGKVGTSDTTSIFLHFTSPLPQATVGAAPFNPFIVKNGNRAIEIHLPDNTPTDLIDPSLFGTGDDRSVPATGKYYKSVNNLPWAIHIPVVLDHMLEYTEIVKGYLHFAEWAESSGVSYPDWYLNKPGYRDPSKLWPGL